MFRKLPDSVVLQPSDKKDRIILQINVFISSNCYAISGGGGGGGGGGGAGGGG